MSRKHRVGRLNTSAEHGDDYNQLTTPFIQDPNFAPRANSEMPEEQKKGDFRLIAEELYETWKEVANNSVREFFNTEKLKYENQQFDSPKLNVFPVDQSWKANAYHRQTVMDFLLPLATNKKFFPNITDLESFQANTGMDVDAYMKLGDFLEPDGVYLWTEEAFKTATAMPLPKHTITRELLHLKNMFFVFEKPLLWEYEHLPEEQAKRYTTWIAVSSDRETDKIVFTFDSRNQTVEEKRNSDSGEPTELQIQALENIYGADIYQVSYDVHRNCFPSSGTMNGTWHEPYKLGSADNILTQLEGIRPNGEAFQNHNKNVLDNNVVGDGYIRFDSVYPDFLETAPMLETVGELGDAKVITDFSSIIVQLLNFLQSTATDVVPTKNSRNIRRRFDGEPTVETDSINVVNLRRVKYQGGYVPMGDGTGKSIKYKGSWWVTGHYKNQRYGIGRSKIKVIWIQPFMKGQGDLMERVNKVRR